MPDKPLEQPIEKPSTTSQPETPKSTTPAPASSTSGQKAKKKNRGLLIGIGALIVLIAAFIVSGVGIYKFHWKDNATAALTSVIPFPAARVNFSLITMGQYQNNVRAIDKYFEATKDTTQSADQQGQDKKQLIDSILDRLVENEVIRQLAEKYDVTIADQDVETEFNNVVEQTGSQEDVVKTLNELYGWSIDEFKANVLIPYIERTKLQKKLIADKDVNKDAWEKINRLLGEVKKEGADFGEIAKKESDGPSAPDGGNLGEFGKGEMVKEFEEAAYALEPGQISDIVQTEFGFHIIKVESKKDDKITARHILVQPKDFDAWLAEQKNGFKINKFI